VRAGFATAAPGAQVSVPIELVSLGDENAFGFSLTFDPAVLSNPQVALGSDTSAATLGTNLTLASQGRAGIALALPSGQKFSAGTRQLAVVTFTVANNATALSTPIGFGDQPIPREVTDANADQIPAVFTPGVVSISAGYEADVTPRPTGNNNGSVTVSDWVQVGRFIAGLDAAAAGSEFQRADCAPRDTRGDGKLTVVDWTQAMRYAIGLDPVTPVGGPTSPAPALSAIRPAIERNARNAYPRTLRAIVDDEPGQTRTVRLVFDAQGNEHALGFSLLFNPSQWSFASATAADEATGAMILVNSTEASSGRVGILLSLPAERSMKRGSRQLLVLKFNELGESRGLRLSLGDQPVAREVVNANARVLTNGLTLEAASKTERSIINVSPASFTETEFAAEQIVAAFGSRLATATATADAQPLPTLLAGTTVKVTDSRGVEREAQLLFVSPGQVNYQLPSPTATGVATVTITSADGTVSTGLVEIADAAPSLFTANADGEGVAAAVLLRIKADGTASYEPVAVFDQEQNRFVASPIDLGSSTRKEDGIGDQVFLVMFGTGFGRIGASNRATARFSRGDFSIEGEVGFAGRQGGLAGVDQVNVRLPRSLSGRGEVEVALSLGSKTTNSVKISFK
jgi:uncharacterized protein (TIGR03437 family)